MFDDFSSLSDSVHGSPSFSFQMMKLLVPHMESVLQVYNYAVVLVGCVPSFGHDF